MKLFIFLFLALLLGACSDNGSSVNNPPPQEVSVKVAVILPLNESGSIHWRNTADWFEENLQKAFSRSHNSSVKLDLEWIDEDSSNMKELSATLIKNDDIKAIIGPLKEDKLDTLAGYLAIANKHGPRKTLIAPKATDAEIVRKFGDEKWFFSLTETDATLCGNLLSSAKAMDAKSVSLLTSSANEEKTFLDWFAFQAVELGLQINAIESFNDTSDVKTVAENFFSTSQDFVICIPANYMEAIEILKAHKKQKSTARLLFSENAVDPEILKYPEAEGLEAVTPGASPESGFDIAYFTKFDIYPGIGSAQFYDALMLVAFAQTEMLASDDSLFLDEHIKNLVKQNSYANSWAWEPFGMSGVLEKIQKGQANIDFSGASSSLVFNESSYSIISETIYTHWIAKNQKFYPLNYKSAYGNNRTNNSEISYKWYFTHILPQIQGIDSTRHIEYPPLKGNYALLVATTRTWGEYRHESGVYSMYHKLKNYGYDDDHIILIAEKDIITSDYNPAKGTWVDYNEEQIIDSLNADYKISELEPQDVLKILTGQKSERLPHVIQSDSTQNIFVYWSGHGDRGNLGWKIGGTRSGSFSYDDMQTLISTLSKEKKFRKMLWVVETCYSGSVCKAFDDVGAEGALCMTATNENETSKGLMYYAPFNQYLANSFSYNFMSILDNSTISSQDNYDIPLSDMYSELYKATLGSHVSIYNSQNYGNLKLNKIGEFLVPVQ